LSRKINPRVERLLADFATNVAIPAHPLAAAGICSVMANIVRVLTIYAERRAELLADCGKQLESPSKSCFKHERRRRVYFFETPPATTKHHNG
jgi:hypothetical protein